MGTLHHLRYALRILAKSPTYSAVAILTLGLAIGANTAMFSAVSGVLLRPLPYAEPERLMLLWEQAPNYPELPVSYLDFVDWRKAQKSFADLAAYRRESFNLIGGERPERLSGEMISASLLPLLAVQPLRGRNFLPEEDLPGAPPVVLLGEGLWRRRYGGDPQVVGRAINLDGKSRTVVGILSAQFRFAPEAEVYVPIGGLEGELADRKNHPDIYVVGRLKAGATIEQARAQLDSIGRALAEQYTSNRQVMPNLAPLQEKMVRQARRPLLLLMGAVAFVLLIAIANVANLMLARGALRRKEMAIRAALGAQRLDLIAQLLIESAVLGLIGAALGLLLALWGIDLFQVSQVESLPRGAVIGIDGRVLAFALVLALGSSLLFGLFPALSASRVNLQETIKEGDTRTASGGGLARLRSALVVIEVALSLALLVGAGLSIRTMVGLQRSELGFLPERLTTLRIDLPPGRYGEAPRLRTLLDSLIDRVAAIPGVESVTLSAGLPLTSASETTFWVAGRPRLRADDVAFAVYFPASPNIHETLKIPLVAGRRFASTDRAGTEPVAIIDEMLARQMFGDGDPLGKQITHLDGTHGRTIVGVARHIINYGLGQPEFTQSQFYFPYQQLPDDELVATLQRFDLAVRSSLPVADLAGAVAGQVALLDPEQPIYDVKAMEERVDESLGARRFATTLLVIFAGLALVLTVVGLYAVISYTTTQRTHEFGIRMALGAQARDIEFMVLRQGLRLAGLGLALGLGTSLALSRVLSSLLEDVVVDDPVTYVAVALGLTAIALLASWIPARRATRIDPMVALRSG